MGESSKKIKTVFISVALAAIFSGAGFWLWKTITSPASLPAEIGQAISALPAEAQELLNTTAGEKIQAQTSTDSFLSKLELPARSASAAADVGGPKTQNTENGTQNIENGTQNTENGTQNIENGTQNTENELAVQTVFDTLDDQVRQTISFKNGQDSASFKVNLENSSGYRQGAYQTETSTPKNLTRITPVTTPGTLPAPMTTPKLRSKNNPTAPLMSMKICRYPALIRTTAKNNSILWMW